MSVKAFQLIPAVEKFRLAENNLQTKIECIECSGKKVYIGTNDSFIVEYVVEETVQTTGKLVYNSRKDKHKYLGFKKAVLSVKAAPALNRLLALCEGNLLILSLLDLEILGESARLKGVSTFCINENPLSSNPFSIQICIAKKKLLQVCNITEEKLIHVKDIYTTEPALELSMDGAHICVAVPNRYVVHNYEKGQMQELFTYTPEEFIPLIHRINKEEFLLLGPGDLGIFVTTAGISERPPIQWSHKLSSFTYFHPYIIGLSEEVIVIYSILDQQQKQIIPFAGGKFLGNFDGRLYVCTSSSIYNLAPVPWEIQVQELLTDGHVEGALQLAENAVKFGLPWSQGQILLQRTQRQAAFMKLTPGHFQESKELLVASQVDSREVISLFPGLLPCESTFVRSVPPLHQLADIVQVTKGDPETLLEGKTFLVEYLEEVRSSEVVSQLMEIDTALVKLYAELQSSDLQKFVDSPDISCSMADCTPWLLQHKCYHSLALLQSRKGALGDALETWAKLVDGKLEDEAFPGLNFFVDFLSKLKDHQRVWQYADFVLEKDPILGVGIFTLRTKEVSESDTMKPDLVANYLKRYPSALLCYLEHIIYKEKSEDEQFHTHLALLYLEQVMQLLNKNCPEDLATSSKRLRCLLQSSSNYRVPLLLGKMANTQLYNEMAILYGKLEDHDKALRILVYKLCDYSAAEEYCILNSKDREKSVRQKIFHTLLHVYLSPSEGNEKPTGLLEPALKLLNAHASEFNAIQVLAALPPSWPLPTIENFIRGSLRSQLHQSRMRRIESSLARGENVQKKFVWHDVCRDALVLIESNYCCVCKKPFEDAACARFPNGIVTHTWCVQQRNVCPLTGAVFRDY